MLNSELQRMRPLVPDHIQKQIDELKAKLFDREKETAKMIADLLSGELVLCPKGMYRKPTI